MTATPEQRTPATYGCEKCRITYSMGSETTVYLMLRQPWFNHLTTVCPKCHRTWRVWRLIEATIRYIEANNTTEGDEVHWSVTDFADAATVRQFEIDHDLKPLTTYDLTPRQERRVAFFAYLLEKDVQS